MWQEEVKKWRLRYENGEKKNKDVSEILESGCLTVVARRRPLLPFESLRIENKESAVISSSSSSLVTEFECVSLSLDDHTIHLHREDVSVDSDFKLKTTSQKVHRCCPSETEERLHQSLLYDSTPCGSLTPSTNQNDISTTNPSYNDATIIAYGQTGSGKTYTISKMTHEAMIDLMSRAQVVTLLISAFELYGERCYDLLYSNDEGSKDGKEAGEKRQLKILEDENGEVHAHGATEIQVDSVAEGQAVLERVFLTRVSCSTRMNNSSSRSHAFFIFKSVSKSSEGEVTCGQNGTSMSPCETIRFVDLAGNERWEDALDHDKHRIEEMKAINYSLGNMKECFRKMATGFNSNGDASYMPYRRSKLTMLLKNVLERRTKVIFIAHLAPLRSSLKHIENTCQFVNSLLEKVTRAEREKSNFTGPLQWNKLEMMNFVRSLDCNNDDRRFHALSESFQLTGKLFSVEWIGDVEKRVVAAGGTKDDANYIYDKFHELVKKDKERQKKKHSKTNSSVGAKASNMGTGSTRTSSIRKQMMAKFADSFNENDCVISTAPNRDV